MYESPIKVDWESNYAEKTEEELRKLIEEAYRDDLLNRFLYDHQTDYDTEQEAIDAQNTRYKYDYPLNYNKHYLDRLGRGDLNGEEN